MPTPFDKTEQEPEDYERLIDAKYRVIDQFIDFLFTFDAPNKQPLVNYLSKSLEQIQ